VHAANASRDGGDQVDERDDAGEGLGVAQRDRCR
jgi:hypothetical protein